MAGPLLVQIVAFVHFVKDLIIDWVLGWYLGEHKQIPGVAKQNGFLLKSASELARMIRMKEITSRQLVQACIDRIAEVNPVLNAVVDGPFEEALEEAQAIDERILLGQISEDEFSEKPFLGVPFTTKDSTSVKGKLHTLGLVSRRKTRSKEDAECVALMKQAGGIILATSNIPEVNKWQESRNNVIGQTNNPYDTRRTVGGSSGGEGALISACASTMGLGTDIGGSIRMPAYYCGIFGHKPTVGLVNTRGCTFRTGKEPSTMVVAGPMCKHADDLMPMLKVLVGPKKCASLKLDKPVNVRKLKFYFIRESGGFLYGSVSGQLQAAMTKVVDHLADIADEEPKEVKLFGTEKTPKMWNYWMTQEPADFNAMLGNGVKLNAFVELGKKLVGRSDFTLAAIYSMIFEFFPKGNADKIKEITRKCDEELTNLLGDDGILLYHNYTRTAPFHYAPLINIFNFSYWSLFNVLHVPATQVPLGLDSDGLPLGIQVVASRNRDRDCLAVAEELAKAFNGWVPPFAANNV